MGLYQKFVLPWLIDVAMRNKEVAARRAELIPKASGAVLEIGIGSGLNLPFFPSAITRLVGVDPSAELLSMARPKLGGVSFPVELFCRSAEDLPFDDQSFDTAVLTWTLCSIPHPERALAEIKRVLKPDGRLLFVEHGLSTDPNVQVWQHRLTPMWKCVGGGCHLNRKIDHLARPAGFQHRRAEDQLPFGAEGDDLHVPGDCMSRLIGTPPNTTHSSASDHSEGRRYTATAAKLLLGIAAFKLLVHLYAGRHYGYFVDELYYLACSRHLDWGYVDQPPLIALMAWMARSLLGDSLPAIRFFPAVAGAVKVGLTALLARELGGKLFAQGLAATAILVAPGFLALDNILSMNAFEGLFWLGCACLLVRIIKTANPRLWIWFGIVAGVGLENKHSMLIFGCGIFLGLVLTPQRRWLADRWLWIGGAIAFLIFVPNLVWNIHHQFPFLELQSNIRRSGRNVPLGPMAFFGQQILAMHPLALPIWLAGLWFYFFSKVGKPFRALGWAWAFTAAVIVGLSPRIYYLWPAFPMLFAAGSVTLESLLARPRLHWIKLAYPTLLVIVGVVLSPQVIPVLPPETYIAYAKTLHFQPPAIETHKLGPLPQIYADQFGWEEMVATVAQVYHDLPSDIRHRTAIFGQNYGQAGAVDLFGPKYGLPPAISGHQNYFLWGPRDYTGESVIVMQGQQQELDRRFAGVQKVASVYHPYSMPYQHFDVFYCRGLKQPLKAIWPQLKKWN